MPDWNAVRAELEEQRCLIEQQQIEIQRQRRHLELQRRLTEHLETELAAMKAQFQQASLVLPATQARNGNGHVHRDEQ